ncbi:MAG TPA: GNAT family N-acetyltransferase [Candidatus Limiplasma sp.]|nr:GNAT family N-acetyltransferase [Candidatus Limiplasma sp.]HRX08302.1 GNAT family N-acetyltransferase [Candidatus Limiplasma sp.]
MAFVLHTEALLLKTAELSFAESLLAYFQRNSAFLKGVEPKRDAHFYTLEFQEAQLQRDMEAILQKTGVRFYIFLKTDPDTIIGSISLSNIVWGSFLSCFLGYRLDEQLQGKGLMTQALNAVIRFGFETLGLHRIEANIMPRNLASRRVLEKCGFREEGISRKYLKINGVWEDHVHMVLLNDNDKL